MILTYANTTTNKHKFADTQRALTQQINQEKMDK